MFVPWGWRRIDVVWCFSFGIVMVMMVAEVYTFHQNDDWYERYPFSIDHDVDVRVHWSQYPQHHCHRHHPTAMAAMLKPARHSQHVWRDNRNYRTTPRGWTGAFAAMAMNHPLYHCL